MSEDAARADELDKAFNAYEIRIRRHITGDEGVAFDMGFEAGLAARDAELATQRHEITKLHSQLEVAEQRAAEEAKIVDRVWAALGIANYEQARGKSITEHVAALRAEVARLTKEMEHPCFCGMCHTPNQYDRTLNDLSARLEATLRERDVARAEVARLLGQISEKDMQWNTLLKRAERLEAALRRYGKHDSSCVYDHYGATCSCGLSVSLAPPETPQ